MISRRWIDRVEIVVEALESEAAVSARLVNRESARDSRDVRAKRDCHVSTSQNARVDLRKRLLREIFGFIPGERPSRCDDGTMVP